MERRLSQTCANANEWYLVFQKESKKTQVKAGKKLKPLDLAVDPDDLPSNVAASTEKKKSTISESIKPQGNGNLYLNWIVTTLIQNVCNLLLAGHGQET